MEITYQKANRVVKQFLTEHPSELNLLKHCLAEYNIFMRRCFQNITPAAINSVYKTNLWLT